MPTFSRLLISINNDEEHCEVLVNRQTKDGKSRYSQKLCFHSGGSTVVVQCEEGELWTHGTIEGKCNHNHNERSYNV